MILPSFITLLLMGQCVLATPTATQDAQDVPARRCRAIPGDPLWPAPAAWDALNQTVRGNLIKTIPIASPCHRTYAGQTNPLYNEAKCRSLRDTWFLPETHYPSASSPMAYQFTNNSCNPFSSADSPCTLGYYPVYSIKATSAEDLIQGVLFAKKHFIRLVIRNTGHDYLGKSTGAHSLVLWTHHLKSIELIKKYSSPGSSFTGPAIKIGAGVQAIKAYEFAHSHGLMVVGGNCPTVGMAGGYSQGGGHGPLSSKYGLSADQVLEWQVVTSQGKLVTASATQNPDLFWALRGGGGGTYGIVVSLTVKAFPDTYFSTAYLTVPDNGTNTDSLYSAIGNFIQRLPTLVDSGLFVLWLATPMGFMLSPAMAPGFDSDELDELLQPTLLDLEDLGLDYQYTSYNSPNFLTAYNALQGSWNVSDYNVGGRLIPRDIIENNIEGLTSAVRHIGTKTLFSAVAYNLDIDRENKTSVNPYMRKSIFNAFIGVPISYSDWAATKAAQDIITDDLLPALENLTPNGGAYLNEADFQQPDFQSLFYGENYAALLRVKDTYDSADIFYAKTAVGSNRWKENPDGRLCRV